MATTTNSHGNANNTDGSVGRGRRRNRRNGGRGENPQEQQPQINRNEGTSGRGRSGREGPEGRGGRGNRGRGRGREGGRGGVLPVNQPLHREEERKEGGEARTESSRRRRRNFSGRTRGRGGRGRDGQQHEQEEEEISSPPTQATSQPLTRNQRRNRRRGNQRWEDHEEKEGGGDDSHLPTYEREWSEAYHACRLTNDAGDLEGAIAYLLACITVIEEQTPDQNYDIYPIFPPPLPPATIPAAENNGIDSTPGNGGGGYWNPFDSSLPLIVTGFNEFGAPTTAGGGGVGIPDGNYFHLLGDANIVDFGEAEGKIAEEAIAALVTTNAQEQGESRRRRRRQASGGDRGGGDRGGGGRGRGGRDGGVGGGAPLPPAPPRKLYFFLIEFLTYYGELLATKGNGIPRMRRDDPSLTWTDGLNCFSESYRCLHVEK